MRLARLDGISSLRQTPWLQKKKIVEMHWQHVTGICGVQQTMGQTMVVASLKDWSMHFI